MHIHDIQDGLHTEMCCDPSFFYSLVTSKPLSCYNVFVMKTGRFITFEGPDGSGKTTVSLQVYQQLKEEGYPVLYTREPGGSAIAEQIRKVILDPQNTAMDARTEALLYAASRRQHLVEVILPALEQGIHVISDRFIDSSLAYQGVGRSIGIPEVLAINQFAVEGHMPEKTLFLDVKPETGLKRIEGREFLDRLDQEKLDFHEKVYAGYQEILKMFPDRFVCIDAEQDKEAVINDSMKIIREFLND